MNTISSEYGEVERTIREAAVHSKDCVDDEEILVAAVHPDVAKFFREQLDLPEGAIFGSVKGIEYTMVTDSAPGFCVVICNENL